ncbi:MAG: hypothetical protein ABI383_15420 [Acidobacteriaceae bacterium]
MDDLSGAPVKFRICETPCFLPTPLLRKMERFGGELTRQLVGNRDYHAISEGSIPAEFKVPNEDATPLFLQVDFGLVRGADGELEPKLVELQGFPSLYAYQSLLAHEYIEAYGLSNSLKVFSSGLDTASYGRLLCDSILGGHDPENVALLEIDPLEQKTLPDFLLTKQLCGIETVNIRDVKREGMKLLYPRAGRLIPIERIYNRTIVDELVRKDAHLSFDFRDELDVEWAGHPNWYFRVSKFSIPYLRHACVPRTQFLDQIEQLPADRENYLLKPLYSFAGAGITFAPTDADLAAIPAARRNDYILQERMSFEPVIETPHGATQAEIRIMYIWPPHGELTPVMSLVRMGRGKMMGVDHNRDLEWVGASAGLTV